MIGLELYRWLGMSPDDANAYDDAMKVRHAIPRLRWEKKDRIVMHTFNGQEEARIRSHLTPDENALVSFAPLFPAPSEQE